MRQAQFVNILSRLRLGPASKRTATAFGLSLRQLQRITIGKSPVPAPVALLAIAYTKHGLPEPLWNPDVSRSDALADTGARAIANLTRIPQKPAETEQVETPPLPAAVTEPTQPAPSTTVQDPAKLVATVSAAKLEREQKANNIRLKRLR